MFKIKIFGIEMKIDSIDINQTLNEAKRVLDEETGLSPSFKAVFKVLILVVTILINRLKLNSSNSSKSPSTDPNRKRKKKAKSNNKPGGQNGHKGWRLEKLKDPDKIEFIKIDKTKIPSGAYKESGYESRQVIDINISRVVTEYRAQILIDQFGKKYIASFPDDVTDDVQYGSDLKAHCVYMSQFQLLPYNRIQDYFREQIGIPISEGSIYNFNKEAYNLLEKFEDTVKSKLVSSYLIHSDETGININGKRKWLHSASNDLWTYYYPHEKRGCDAMNDIGILPNFNGILCHDHWKPYYKYNCLHSLCNAHHLRELERAIEQENQKWAKDMQLLLLEINESKKNKGFIFELESQEYRKRYQDILAKAKEECPMPEKEKHKRGRVKKSKSRNLLERFINYENDVLRFMEDALVPFTNNLSENDIRMTKVQQKISGCFRSWKGAYIFCRIRSFLSTCRKNRVTAASALQILLKGECPGFINDS